MLVWALRAIGADPAFFVGGEVPGLGADGAAANAGWGEGEWVVAEADESDASFLELGPEIAVVTNVEMDHHSRWGSLAELRARLRASSSRRPRAWWRRRTAASPTSTEGQRVVGFDAEAPGPAELRSPSPAATTCSTPAPRWPRSSWPGSTSTPPPPRSPTSPGCGGGSS